MRRVPSQSRGGASGSVRRRRLARRCSGLASLAAELHIVSSGEEMPNEGRVYFGLFGDDFDPESLSIGISPIKTARKGSPIPKQSSWIYSSERVQSDLIDVYEMSSALALALRPYAEQIREAMKKHNLEAVLEVVITMTEARRGRT